MDLYNRVDFLQSLVKRLRERSHNSSLDNNQIIPEDSGWGDRMQEDFLFIARQYFDRTDAKTFVKNIIRMEGVIQ